MQAAPRWARALRSFVALWASGAPAVSGPLQAAAKAAPDAPCPTHAHGLVRAASALGVEAPAEHAEGAVGCMEALRPWCTAGAGRRWEHIVGRSQALTVARVRCLSGAGRWAAAAEVLHRCDLGTLPSATTACIDALCRGSDWATAVRLAANAPTSSLPQLCLALHATPDGWAIALRLNASAVGATGDRTPARVAEALAELLASRGRWHDVVRVLVAAAGPTAEASPLRAACHALRHQWATALRVAAAVATVRRDHWQDRRAVDACAGCCAEPGRWVAAARVVAAGAACNVAPSSAVAATLVVVFNRATRAPMAAAMLRRVLAVEARGADVGRALNSMVHYSATPSVAQQWAALLEDRGLPMDDRAQRRLVALLADAGDWRGSLSALAAALDRGHLPVPATHDVLQSALRYHGAPWTAAVRLFVAMDRCRVPASEPAFKAVVASCIVQQKQDMAADLLQHTIRRGVGR